MLKFMHKPTTTISENFRVIQSTTEGQKTISSQQMKSNFWGFSLFTLLLALALLSLLNLVNNEKDP